MEGPPIETPVHLSEVFVRKLGPVVNAVNRPAELSKVIERWMTLWHFIY